MAGSSWLVDGHRIATKIKSASGAYDLERVSWKSNPTKACPNCNHIVDNSDVTEQWPGLPRGVKFDPTDQEILGHLLAKAGCENLKPHPFIDEFITTVDKDDGICYTHPQNLPGVKQDGSVSHFFHRAIKAYNTGTRKRRKIHGDDLGDVRWHKTGRTKPVILDGVQKGCKKIMVLYVNVLKGGKAEKTNWVMHQYHLGTGEDEMEGDYVISKVFYQQQQVKQSEKGEAPLSDGIDDALVTDIHQISPKSVTPETSRPERCFPDYDEEKDLAPTSVVIPAKHIELECHEDVVITVSEKHNDQDHFVAESNDHQMGVDDEKKDGDTMNGCDNGSQYLLDSEELAEAMTLRDELLQSQTSNKNVNIKEEINGKSKSSHTDDENHAGEDMIGWGDSESQYLLDSQQMVEAMTLCDELLQSQSPDRNGSGIRKFDGKPSLSDYAYLGSETLKRDLEDCQALALDPANIDVDSAPDFRLSQLEFGSQDSFVL
ncbi:SUPPRESSOR OF GAMMA RESPONSE 1 [Daucus carota subsp. sativus]|uniref:SUPPRESSOR OF GAMMA RESPONSE 1 n=1 Tax=Daucus carota subsp. sativus TaxID=79200 RepID=UPI0007EFB26B|nr:PREDICTED: NAC domain-containing protein 8 [Daucus carota subsp. sativus]